MKIVKPFLSIVLLSLAFACSKSDDLPKPDFTVLGITSVAVGDDTYKVEKGCMLKLDHASNLGVVGTGNSVTAKEKRIDYAFKGTLPEIKVTSIYADTKIEEKREDKPTKRVTFRITRPGYKETLTFFFVSFGTGKS